MDQLKRDLVDLPSDILWSLIETSTDGLYLWEVSTDRVVWSDGLYETLEVPKDDELDFPDIQQLVHPDHRDLHQQAINRSMEQRAEYMFDGLFVTGTGREVWLHVRGVWREGADGGLCLLGYVTDITDLKQAEFALRDNEETFRAFFDNCPAAAYIKDDKSVHLYGNQKAADIAGVSVDAFIGGGTHELFEPQTAARLVAVDQQVMREDKTVSWTGEVNNSAGEQRVLIDTKFPIRLSRTNKSLVGGFVVDITEERRTQELSNQKQRLESLGLLVGGIAHDFNNHMATVRLSAELLEQGADGDQRELLDGILRSADMAAGLCQQMLAYAGMSVEEVERLDLSAFIRQSRNVFDIAVEGRAQLRFDLHPIDVNMSTTHIEQILLNLILNAAQACGEPQCGIRLACGPAEAPQADSYDVYHSWVSQDADRPLAHLSVEDSGCGISAELLDKVFDPFFTTKPEGSGIGLSAVFGIIRAVEGAVGVTSRERCGTRFDIFLPAA